MTLYTIKVKMGSRYLEELFLPNVTPRMIFIDLTQCIMESFILNIFDLNINNKKKYNFFLFFYFTMYKKFGICIRQMTHIYVSKCLDQIANLL